MPQSIYCHYLSPLACPTKVQESPIHLPPVIHNPHAQHTTTPLTRNSPAEDSSPGSPYPSLIRSSIKYLKTLSPKGFAKRKGHSLFVRHSDKTHLNQFFSFLIFSLLGPSLLRSDDDVIHQHSTNHFFFSLSLAIFYYHMFV